MVKDNSRSIKKINMNLIIGYIDYNNVKIEN